MWIWFLANVNIVWLKISPYWIMMLRMRVTWPAKDRIQDCCLSSIEISEVGKKVKSQWGNSHLLARVIGKTLSGRARVNLQFDIDQKTSLVTLKKILRFMNDFDADESDEKCFVCNYGGNSECLSPDSFLSIGGGKPDTTFNGFWSADLDVIGGCVLLALQPAL